MTLHLCALPHTQITDEYLTCAYTQKIAKFCRMFPDDVVLYAPEGSEAPCKEHVVTMTRDEQLGWFGKWDATQSPNVDWDSTKPWWTQANVTSILGIQRRHEDGDLVLITAGLSQKPIVDALPGVLPVEWAVGYKGILTSGHRIFESYAWMHHIYGLNGIEDGAFFDSVVPNFFDPDELPLGDGDGEYAVWLGRWTERKGFETAIAICQEAGIELIMAGPGFDGRELPDGVQHIGPVGVTERAALLGGAQIGFVPTGYIEPFGGVAVEMMLCGTPVISTDWGAFAETVETGVTGHRIRTRGEGVDAIRRCQEIPRASVRERALERYSLDAVKPQFEAVFGRLTELWTDGWYTKKPLHETRLVDVAPVSSDARATT